ncbi:MAG: efflux RND transporter periplasmic adaptor subunit [Fimbriimonadaceae bacterium]|nr:efflux RND transporter periplasmic adaptor subunit [Fimbriimonadaceae bacterium]QYK56060.1 MAG: efflux RND transporter periplasmic adaptor subunit [Fimbriimonadaceae bacterium]
MKGAWALGLVVLPLALGCGTSQGNEPREEHAAHEDGTVALTAEQLEGAGIRTEEVRERVFEGSFIVPGTVSPTPAGRAVVTPPVAGRLVRLDVKPGDRVRQGQVLGMVESTELAEAWSRTTDAARVRDEAQARLREAEGNLALARSRVEAANQTLARQRQLAEAGAFSQAPLQAAQGEWNEAQAALLAARNEQASHRELLLRLERLFRDGLVSRNDLDAARLELEQDTGRVALAQARFDLAKAAFERERGIAQRGLLNAREVQAAESDVRTARLGMEQAELAVRFARGFVASAEKGVGNARAAYQTYTGGAKASGGRTPLLAPISGTVAEVAVTRGQAVDRTQALFEITDLSAVYATALVPERSVGLVQRGAKVQVTAQALSGRVFEGTVQSVPPSLDAKTRTLAVPCLLEDTGGVLKPHMFVQVSLSNGAPRSLPSVPTKALVEEGGEQSVFVKEGGGFVRRKVRTVGGTGGYRAVESGVKPGELVVTDGAFILKSQQNSDELRGHEH